MFFLSMKFNCGIVILYQNKIKNGKCNWLRTNNSEVFIIICSFFADFIRSLDLSHPTFTKLLLVLAFSNYVYNL